MDPEPITALGVAGEPQASTSARKEPEEEKMFEVEETLFVLPTESVEEKQYGEKKRIAVMAKFSMYPVKQHKLRPCIIVLHSSLFEIHDVPRKKKEQEEVLKNGGRSHRHLILFRDIFNVCITDEMGGRKCTCISIMTVDHTFYVKLTDPEDNVQHFYTTLFERTRESRSQALLRPVYKEEFFPTGWDVVLVTKPKLHLTPFTETHTNQGDFVTQNPWAAGHRRFVLRGGVFAFFVKDARPQRNVMSPWKADDYFDLPSNTISAMGCQQNYFALMLGRSSEYGPVSLWLECESVKMAKAMQIAADQKSQREASKRRDAAEQNNRNRNLRNMERRARSENEQQKQLKCQEEEEEKRMAKIMAARAAAEKAEKIARGEIEPDPEESPQKKRSIINRLFFRESKDGAEQSTSPGAETATKKTSLFNFPFRASFTGNRPNMEQIKQRAEAEARERAEEVARLEEEDRRIREEQQKEKEAAEAAAAAAAADENAKPKKTKKKKTKKHRLKGEAAIRQMEVDRRMEEEALRRLRPGETFQLPRQYAALKSPPTDVEFGGGIMYPLDERQLPYNIEESRRHQSLSSKSVLSGSASRDGRANSLGSRSTAASRRLAASTTVSSSAGRNVSASGSANTVVSTSIAEEDESADEPQSGLSQKLALQPDIAVKPMPNDNRTRAHSWGSRSWLSNRLGNKRNSDAQAVPPSPRSHLLPSTSSELLVPERKRAESFGSAAPPRRPIRSMYGATVAVDSNEFVEFDFENSSKTGSPLDRSRHSSLGVQLPESVQTARECARARAKGEKFQPRNVCNRTILEEPSPSRLTTSISAQPITTIVEERDDDSTAYQPYRRSPSVSSYDSDESPPRRPKKILYDWEEYDPNNPNEIPDIIFRPASKSLTSGPFHHMMGEYEERTVYHRPKNETYVEGPWIRREPIPKDWAPHMRPMSASMSAGRRRVAFDAAPQTIEPEAGKPRARRHKRRCHRELTDEAEKEARLQRHRERLQQRHQQSESMEQRTLSMATPRTREVSHSMESGRSLDSARPRHERETRRMESQDSVETLKSQRSADTHRVAAQKSVESQRVADSPRQTPDSASGRQRRETPEQKWLTGNLSVMRDRLLENYGETEKRVARICEKSDSALPRGILVNKRQRDRPAESERRRPEAQEPQIDDEEEEEDEADENQPKSKAQNFSDAAESAEATEEPVDVAESPPKAPKRRPIEKQRELDNDPTPKSSPRKQAESKNSPKPKSAETRKPNRNSPQPNTVPPPKNGDAAAADRIPTSKSRSAAVSPVVALKKSSALPSGDSPLGSESESESESDASTVRHAAESEQCSDADDQPDRTTVAAKPVGAGGRKKQPNRSSPPSEPEGPQDRQRRSTLIAPKPSHLAKKSKTAVADSPPTRRATVNFEKPATAAPNRRRTEEPEDPIEVRRTEFPLVITKMSKEEKARELMRLFDGNPPSQQEIDEMPTLNFTVTRQYLGGVVQQAVAEREQVHNFRREFRRRVVQEPFTITQADIEEFMQNRKRLGQLKAQFIELRKACKWAMATKPDTRLLALYVLYEAEKQEALQEEEYYCGRSGSFSSAYSYDDTYDDTVPVASESRGAEMENFRKYSSAERQTLSSRSGLATLPQCFWTQPPQRKNAYGQPSPQGQRKVSRRHHDPDEGMLDFENRPLVTVMPSTYNPSDHRTVQQKLAAIINRQTVDYMELLVPKKKRSLPEGEHPIHSPPNIFDKPRRAVNATS